MIIPSGWADDGGMYKYRFSGFLNKVMSNLFAAMVRVMSMKSTESLSGMKTHSKLCGRY